MNTHSASSTEREKEAKILILITCELAIGKCFPESFAVGASELGRSAGPGRGPGIFEGEKRKKTSRARGGRVSHTFY